MSRRFFKFQGRRKLAIGVLLAASACIGIFGFFSYLSAPHAKDTESVNRSRGENGLYRPTDSEWRSLSIEPVSEHVFHSERLTEGKIAVDEDHATPIFSPYAGRIAKLLVRPGDVVERGQPLFVIEAADTVQALNDFITALGAANKARSTLNLAQIVEKRANDLYAGRAVPLKDLQQSQADLTTAQNDIRSAETALEAARNRLHILGRTDNEIDAFAEKRQISADTPIYSPIAGTVIQRKAGPGQFMNSGASDPVYVIGDMSTVWITAFVRETEADGVAVGQDLKFSVLALPGRTFSAPVDYVAPALDPTSRRLLVRATIENKDLLLKPEMFASVTIYSSGDHPAVAVPRQALIYEGAQARVWVVRGGGAVELRQITTGLVNGDLVEAVSNLKAGEKIITRGSLFIDRAASGT